MGLEGVALARTKGPQSGRWTNAAHVGAEQVREGSLESANEARGEANVSFPRNCSPQGRWLDACYVVKATHSTGSTKKMEGLGLNIASGDIWSRSARVLVRPVLALRARAGMG